MPGAFVHQVSSLMDDGRLLLVPGDGYSAVLEAPRQEWVFETQPILAVDAQASRVDTLVVLPHLRRWFGARGAPPGTLRVQGTAGGFPGGFAWARSDRAEVHWYDGSGGLVQIARWNEEAEPFTAEYRAWLLEAFEEAWQSAGEDESFVTSQLSRMEESLDRHDGPLPYWDAFVVDRAGNTWTRRYGPLVARSNEWRVVTRDGVFRGRVDLPAGVVDILDVTDDHVLALERDELDVLAVALFRLTKGS